jgi:hypothetical protein
VGQAHLGEGQLSDSEDAQQANATYAFEADQQGYIFLRSVPGLNSDSEWALFTNLNGTGTVPGAPWQFPAVGGGQPDLPLSWFLDSADTAILGAINGGDLAGGSTGAGEYSDSSTDFSIRTHGVPEPTHSLLWILTGLVLLGRRARENGRRSVA